MTNIAYVALSNVPGPRRNTVPGVGTPAPGGNVTWQAVLLAPDDTWVPLNPGDLGDPDQGIVDFHYADTAKSIRHAVATSVRTAYADSTIKVVFLS